MAVCVAVAACLLTNNCCFRYHFNTGEWSNVVPASQSAIQCDVAANFASGATQVGHISRGKIRLGVALGMIVMCGALRAVLSVH